MAESSASFDAPQRSSEGAGRLPEVDGLRAFAVLLVMAFHFDLPVPGGFFGVDLFLVISGFVIARRLLGAAESSQPTAAIVARFISRRASRLLPAAAMAIAATIALTFWGRPSLGSPMRTVAHGLAGIGGLANWFVVAFPDRPGETARLLLHTWSLGLEEQCYLVLPFVLLAGRRWARMAAFGLFVASLLLAIVSCVVWPSPDVSFFSTLSRVAPVGSGVGLAALLHGRAVMPTKCGHRLFLGLLGCLAPAVLLIEWRDSRLYSGGLVLAGLAFSGLVGCAAVGGDAPSFRVLRSAPVQFISARSYSLYLVHFPVAYLFSSFGFGLRTVLRVILSFVLAELLHRFVEYRFLPKAREPHRVWRLAPIGMGMCGVAGFLLARGAQ